MLATNIVHLSVGELFSWSIACYVILELMITQIFSLQTLVC